MRRSKINYGQFLVAALWDLFVIGTVLALCVAIVRTAKADCVVVLSSANCGPCQAMRPVEEKLRGEGYDLRVVDIDQRPDLKRAYRVLRVPTFVYVAETPYANYELGRLTGLRTEAELRAFATPRQPFYNPAPVANLVRSVLGMPILVGY